MQAGGHSGIDSEGNISLSNQAILVKPSTHKSTLILTFGAGAVGVNLASIIAPEQVARLAGPSTPQWAALMSIMALAFVLAWIWRAHQNASNDTPLRLEQILDMLPLSAVVWQHDGSLEHCNAIMRRSFGLPETDALNAAQIQKLRVCDRHAGSMTSNRNGEFELEREDGRVLHVTSLHLTDGRRLCVLKDISDHRRTKRQLAKSLAENQHLTQQFQEQALKAETANRSKTAFLAHLSHDIRTPLNHIIGFADLIRQEAFGTLGNPRYHVYLDDIMSSGERLLDSFAEVLELAELDGGRRVLKREPVLASSLFDELGLRFNMAAERAGIDLQFEAPAQCWVAGDATPLCRMLGNLIDNALRFTPRGGNVRVIAWESHSEAVVEVTDTGIGISQNKLEQLSQPFVLDDAAFTRQHGGLGLGLAIARSIAELSGGRLAIDSTPPLGTTVAVSLPRTEAKALTNAAA